MKKSERAAIVLRELKKLYPSPPIPLDHTNAFTLLVAVVLSAQSTDKKVNELTKELFNIEVTKEVNEANLSLALFEILNSFTGFYDDYWVTDNIKKIESQVLIEAKFVYDSYKDWMYIKKVVISSEYVNNFKILKLSTRESNAKIKIINTEQFITELQNNNLNINKNNNVWNIEKYF